jgi:hypothetical protein
MIPHWVFCKLLGCEWIYIEPRLRTCDVCYRWEIGKDCEWGLGIASEGATYVRWVELN